MAVIATKYQPNKASGDGEFRQSHNLSETWLVRVDAPPPTTSVAAILTAPGVAYGTAHPSFAACKAMKWSYSAVDGSGLLWAVTVQYYVPTVEVDPMTGLPMDAWQARGTTQTLPFYQDRNNNILANSAGDPLEGMEREICYMGWTLTRSYTSINTAFAQIKGSSNKTNNDLWPSLGSSAVDTWKCTFGNLQKRIIVTQSGATQTATAYWEATFEIDYKEDTWHVKPWDMGFNERVDATGMPTSTGTNRRAILGREGRPVKQAVALASGVALPPGTPPVALDFDPYGKISFTAAFGTPS